MLAFLPGGAAGLAIKVAAGLVFAIWWTSAPGADAESEFRTSDRAEKRDDYVRHYYFKGRGRPENQREDVMEDQEQLQPTAGHAESWKGSL